MQGIIYLTKHGTETNRSGRQAGALVLVSPQMERAGLEELRELGLSDPAYLVRSIYMAMEYERLEALGKL